MVITCYLIWGKDIVVWTKSVFFAVTEALDSDHIFVCKWNMKKYAIVVLKVCLQILYAPEFIVECYQVSNKKSKERVLWQFQFFHGVCAGR